MSTYVDPSEIDIDYLHSHSATVGLPEPTSDDEDRFVEMCGKLASDGMTDLVARIMAFDEHRRRYGDNR